jgi:hypothetical protein
LVGQAGNYDYVEFTAEYSPFDMHDLGICSTRLKH